MNILLVSNFFPPINNTACNRIVSFVKHWTSAGHHVTLLTTRKYETIDGPFLEPMPEVDPELFSLIEIDYIVPPPGQLDPSAGEVASSRRARIRKIAPTFLDRRVRWYFACRKVLPTLHLRKFDVIVGSHPSVYPMLLAAHIARKRNIPYVLDFRDLWTADQTAYPSVFPINIFERWLERVTVNKAAGIVCVSEGQADMMRQLFGRPVQVVENGFDDRIIGAWKDPPRIPRPPGRFRIGYFGRFFIPQRDPGPFFEALARVKKRGLDVSRIELVIFGGSHRQAMEHIKKYDVADLVSSFPSVSFEESIREQMNCDALLLIDWNDEAVKGVTPAKLYEIAVLGKPVILMGGYPGSTVEDFILSNRLGLAFYNDVDRLEAFLGKLIAGEPIPFDANIASFEQFSRANLARKYLRILEDAVSGQ